MFNSADVLQATPLDTTHNFTNNSVQNIKTDIEVGTAPSWDTSNKQEGDYYWKLTLSGTDVETTYLYGAFQLLGGASTVTLTTDEDFDAGVHNKTSANNDSLHSWLNEDFADSAKNSVLDEVTDGNGTIAYGSGYAELHTPAGTDASILISSANFELADIRKLRAKIDIVMTMNEGHLFEPLTIIEKSSQPATDESADIKKLRFLAKRVGGDTQIFIVYRKSDNTHYYWDGDSWETSGVAYTITGDTQPTFYVEIVSNGTTVTMNLYNSSLTLLETADITLTDIDDDSDPFWVYVGQPTTSYDNVKLQLEELILLLDAGDWRAATVPTPAGKKLKSTTITMTGGDASNYITKTEILKASDNSVLSTCNDDIQSTTTLNPEDFDNGFDDTYEVDIKIKVYYHNTDAVLDISAIALVFETFSRMRTDGAVFA